MDFASLKKQSNDFSNLIKKVEEAANPSFEKDTSTDNYWKPTPDKAGNALAVIRFLPGSPVDGSDALPWVQYWDHGFQNKVTGKWYIEKSLTTLGQKDPVSEYNTKLWNSSTDDNSPERKQARDQKRRLHYVSNIYVVSDPKNSENEGKVFLFKFGKKIYDKITKMMNPDLESEKKINPFSLWEGANFKLKMTRQNVNMGGRNVSFPNYDESVFLTPGPLLTDEAKMEVIWKSEYSLNEIIDPKNFKTYEQLKVRFEDVLGISVTSGEPVRSARVEEDVPVDKATKTVATKPAPAIIDDDDPDLAEFRKLIED